MIYADMHCDTVSELYRKRQAGSGEGLYENTGHVDLVRMKKGGAMLQNFALYVNMGKTKDPLGEALRMADLYYGELKENEEWIAPVYSFIDILKNRREGKISALLTVEEGGVCRGELPFLRILYRLGVRMMTLTWNYANELGFPAADAGGRRLSLWIWNENRMAGSTGAYAGKEGNQWDGTDVRQGLTEKGKEMVREMEKLGMIIDVSHLSDAGFYDVLEITEKPFVASHSNARAVCPHARNLTDDMIRKLAERGGVMGLNFYPDFLTEVSGGMPNPGTIAAVTEHARHIIRVGGIDCLGLGSDFDGIDGHAQLPDCSHMPLLADALGKCGLSEDAVEKIFYRNVLRVYGEVLGGAEQGTPVSDGKTLLQK